MISSFSFGLRNGLRQNGRFWSSSFGLYKRIPRLLLFGFRVTDDPLDDDPLHHLLPGYRQRVRPLAGRVLHQGWRSRGRFKCGRRRSDSGMRSWNRARRTRFRREGRLRRSWNIDPSSRYQFRQSILSIHAQNIKFNARKNCLKSKKLM